MQDFLEIGQIVNTFGIKGMVKIKPFTDDIRRFDDLKKVYIENNKSRKEYEIEEVIVYGHSFAIDLEYFRYLNMRYHEASWFFYVRETEQEENIKAFIKSNNISKANIIKI